MARLFNHPADLSNIILPSSSKSTHKSSLLKALKQNCQLNRSEAVLAAASIA